MDSETKSPLSHFDESGNAHMVDVGAKGETNRKAYAAGSISMNPEAYRLVKAGTMAKGDVLGVARIAGLMAAKKVDELIPLAHPLLITSSTIDFELMDESYTVNIFATVGMTGKTGVEMEALTAVSISALTIYDMCKAVDKSMKISDIRLLKKTGGKSGIFIRKD
ncbi:cyclic pyranopterin monophosphate synthase MoaC [Desulfotalea psychrophila]|uniref:Cyclic pyranopterin monophosphate synthase n=1 Tax=Desulfotalea psychrophila (strain LSv54 / DSM 12343) TaxID=177439 RepID=Q6AN62_DESPS|nr:cyclic pyranopterin monophosphate synthase MoaC [Desulfotalea psychrophila]CAG36212.1 probable molybdenum cofactor biosynthesis protein C (MoaC) [Desulfotalea psychrophila LSv54]